MEPNIIGLILLIVIALGLICLFAFSDTTKKNYDEITNDL